MHSSNPAVSQPRATWHITKYTVATNVVPSIIGKPTLCGGEGETMKQQNFQLSYLKNFMKLMG